MKKKLSFKLTLLTLITLLMLPTIVTANNPTGNIIITPSILEGGIGEQIQVDKALLVQEVTMTNVKLLDVVILNDKDRIVTRYPNVEGEFSVVEKDTNRKLGFVTLKPSTQGNEISTSYNLEGQFPYYQDGIVFNTLRNANEGDIYFYKRDERSKRPMILNIGEIKNGVYVPKEFIEIKSKKVQIKESLN